MKRLVILLIVGGLAAAPIHDEFREKVVKFHQAYDVFLRKYIGCPAVGKPTGYDNYQSIQCETMLGVVDQAAWHKAREAAKELFELEEKR